MADISLRVENLCKEFLIGHLQDSAPTLRETITRGFTAPFRRTLDLIRGRATGAADLSKRIWALRDISFKVEKGEVVGLIGRNGAGKSTLLKVLSRITPPTLGGAEIYGRVGSLLEVGTGFHPELTGRENIFLNGAILGMRKTEIDAKFDEIVEFSEVGEFLDTPVKHYSSGMYVRLAFAVASHLDPEILFVDEVLAVGDKAFQDKCLNRMENTSRSGRTILFVSHNMAAVSALCDRVIWLEKGRIVMDGPTRRVVEAYLAYGSELSGHRIYDVTERPGNRDAQIVSVRLADARGGTVSSVNISEACYIEVVFRVLAEKALVNFSLVIHDGNGYCAFSSLNNTDPRHGVPLPAGRYAARCTLYANLFNNGRYHASVIGSSAHWGDIYRADRAISFDAVDDGILKMDYHGNYGGVVRPRLDWQTLTLAPEIPGESGR